MMILLQPLAILADKKCKRCGLYEEDTIKSDDVFDEWELCASDFIAPDGYYVHFKDKEFNATFLCPQCMLLEDGSDHISGSHGGVNAFWVIVIGVLISIVSILGAVASYKYWKKKKREQDHARFLKLFEDGDEIDDELGLGNPI
ncbi:PREDICTED: uncharacterized protein LOC104594692 [Nelumbo nucifera]|uniref:Uncharacterized protein LOC104594692 n=1 Tax=Nelumbo nucifera TaxID=4432 RepID=A0A1U7ZHT2_NELNU|nr:PREDICTED: uncharacterized protein LOC104594692 [Nelumbo nucifera]